MTSGPLSARALAHLGVAVFAMQPAVPLNWVSAPVVGSRRKMAIELPCAEVA